MDPAQRDALAHDLADAIDEVRPAVAAQLVAALPGRATDRARPGIEELLTGLTRALRIGDLDVDTVARLRRLADAPVPDQGAATGLDLLPAVRLRLLAVLRERLGHRFGDQAWRLLEGEVDRFARTLHAPVRSFDAVGPSRGAGDVDAWLGRLEAGGVDVG